MKQICERAIDEISKAMQGYYNWFFLFTYFTYWAL